MRTCAFFLFALFLLSSCDDGNVIVTDFNFDSDSQLNRCQNGSSQVFYIVNTNPDETISFSFSDDDFDGTYEGLIGPQTETIDLSESNKLVYRTYNGKINGNSYFCSGIPPSKPEVTDEYISVNGGSIELITSVIAQDDNDGIPAEKEDLNGNGNYDDDDSDGDGIPNYLDTDDDNDNVPTKVEINVISDNVGDNGYPDTDGDGIPNYLDEDDDNDGTLTRQEDLNAHDNLDSDGNPILNPTDDINDDNVPNYLNPNISTAAEPPIDGYLDNIITRKFKIRVIAKNVTLKNTATGEEIVEETLELGSFTVTSNDEKIPMDLE